MLSALLLAATLLAAGSAGAQELEPRAYRTLPTGLNFAPAGFVAAAIAQADLDDLDSEFEAPPRMRPFVQRALERMGEVSVEDYYSLCGRLDRSSGGSRSTNPRFH